MFRRHVPPEHRRFSNSSCKPWDTGSEVYSTLLSPSETLTKVPGSENRSHACFLFPAPTYLPSYYLPAYQPAHMPRHYPPLRESSQRALDKVLHEVDALRRQLQDVEARGDLPAQLNE